MTSSNLEFFLVVDAMYPTIKEGTPLDVNVEYLDRNWASTILNIEVFLNVVVVFLEDKTCFPFQSVRGKVEGFFLFVMKEVVSIYI